MKDRDSYYLAMAELISEQSPDPSTKVGCVIVDGDLMVSQGYNRFPIGFEATEERLNNRDEKYRIVLHAEVVALLNSVKDVRGCTAYVTHAPCSNCQSALAEAGIKKVVVKEVLKSWEDRFPDSYRVAREIREECNISFIEVNNEI